MSRDYRLILAATLLTTVTGTIAGLAVPLVATLRLHADSVAMGWLAACELAPFALLALPAGPWLDRSRKKPVAMATYGVAAVASVVIPIAAATGQLSLAVLYAVGFVQGACNVIGGTALQIHLLQIVGRDGLLAANSRINALQSALAVVGVLLAGAVAARYGPAVVLAGNAVLFVTAVLCIARIVRDETPAYPVTGSLWRDVADGLCLIRDTPMLRALVCFGAVWLMLIGGFGAQLVLFSMRDLGFSTGQWALLAACTASGGSLGALAARRFAERNGVRAVLLTGFLLTGVAMGLYPTSRWLGAAGLAFAGGALVLRDFGIPLYTVNYISLRQRIVPDALLGRVIGAMRGIAVSAAPLGAVVWSHVAERFGIAAAMHLIGAGGVILWWLARQRLPQVQAN